MSSILRRATIHRIEGLKEPQGLAYAPAADILAVASLARAGAEARMKPGKEYGSPRAVARSCPSKQRDIIAARCRCSFTS